MTLNEDHTSFTPEPVARLALLSGPPGPPVVPIPDSPAELEALIDGEISWQKSTHDQIEWRFGCLARYLAAYGERRGWESAGFSSMNEFLEHKATQHGVSRSSMYAARWVGTRIAPYLPEETMRRLGKSKLFLMANSTQEGSAPDPAVVTAAETMNVEAFESFLHRRKKLLAGETLRDVEEVKFGPVWLERTYRDGLINDTLELLRRTEGIEGKALQLIRVFEIAYASLLSSIADEEALEPPRSIPGEIIEAEFTEIIEEKEA